MIEIFFSQVVPFQRLHCFSPPKKVILKFKDYKIFCLVLLCNMVLFAHLQARRTLWEVYFVLGGLQFYNFCGFSVGIRRRMIDTVFFICKVCIKKRRILCRFQICGCWLQKNHFQTFRRRLTESV
jgi:hypothetical protein